MATPILANANPVTAPVDIRNTNAAAYGLPALPANANATQITNFTNAINNAKTAQQNASLNTNNASLTQPASPTAVVSSSMATDHLNNTVIPAMQNGQIAITNQNQQVQDNQNNPQTPAVTPPVQTPPALKTPLTPEQQVANEGTQEAFDTTNGNSVGNQPLNTPLPPRYSFTNPRQEPNFPISSQASTNTGTFVQYANGVYGRYDFNGNYAGAATPGEMQVAQNFQTAQNAYNQILNGTYPPSSVQQSQVFALQASAATQLAAQDTINKNVMGGLATYLNMHGLSGDTVGMAQIAQNATAGAQRIGDIQSKLALDVANMTEADNKDNLAMLKDAYNSSVANAKDMQNEIDNLQAKQEQAMKDFQTAKQQQITDALTKMMDDHTISYQDKQQAIAQVGLDEKTRMDNQTLLDDKVKTSIEAFSAGLSLNPDGSVNFGTDPSTNAPQDPTSLPGVSEVIPGVSYFDSSSPALANQPKGVQTAAAKAAEKAGVAAPDPKDIQSVQNFGTIVQRLNDAEAAFQKIATPNYAGSTIVNGAENLAGSALKASGYTTDYQANLTAYTNARQAVIDAATGLTTGGTGRAFSQILKQLDTFLPAAGLVPDNTKTATAQFDSARKLIYTGIQQLIPTASLPASGAQKYTNATDYIKANPTITLSDGSATSTSAYITSQLQAHPDWTLGSILNALNQ